MSLSPLQGNISKFYGPSKYRGFSSYDINPACPENKQGFINYCFLFLHNSANRAPGEHTFSKIQIKQPGFQVTHI